MSVSCECCVSSGRVLCVELITRPEESYQVWCIRVWSRSLDNRPCPTRGSCCALKNRHGRLKSQRYAYDNALLIRKVFVRRRFYVVQWNTHTHTHTYIHIYIYIYIYSCYPAGIRHSPDTSDRLKLSTVYHRLLTSINISFYKTLYFLSVEYYLVQVIETAHFYIPLNIFITLFSYIKSNGRKFLTVELERMWKLSRTNLRLYLKFWRQLLMRTVEQYNFKIWMDFKINTTSAPPPPPSEKKMKKKLTPPPPPVP